MNKRMRELLAKIEARTEVAKSYMNGESKDITKAEEVLNEVETLKKEYEVEEKIFNAEKETEKLTNKDVAELIDKQYGVKVDKKKIVMETIKVAGGYEIEVKLYPEVTTKMRVIIVPNE